MSFSLIRYVCALALVALTFSASAQIKTVDPVSVGLDPARLDDLRNGLNNDIADGRVPGAVMLIARKGKIGFYEAVGHQTAEKKIKMSSKTIFRIFSMTKPIVSVAAMMLVEEGRLKLDEPLATYIPYFADMSVLEPVGTSFLSKEEKFRPARTQITVRDIMRHTSGLTYGFFKGPVGEKYNEANVKSRDQDLNEFSSLIASMPLMFDPGTAWHYSRSTDVLGRVIEVAAGQSLDVFLAEKIFKPLGMVDTAFFQNEDKADRLAQPVKPSFDMTDPKPMLSGGGGLTSTIEDYLRFAMMLRNRGSLDGVNIIRPDTLAEMTRNQLDTNVDRKFFYPGDSYGFGLGFAVRIKAGSEKDPGTLGDFWWRGLAGTYFWIDPKKDLLVIFMIQDPANRVHYTNATRQWVYNALAK